MNKFTFVTVGGSVSTGSTPLIDLLREYKELKVVDGEFRPGKHMFRMAANISKGIKTDAATFTVLKRNTMNYGYNVPLLVSIYYRILIRLPGPVLNLLNKHAKEMSRKLMAKRGYEKKMPGYKNATRILFDQLADLDARLDTMSREQRMAELAGCLEQFLHSVAASVRRDIPGILPVFDQMINPNKLFSEPGEMTMAKLLPSTAIIVVSRDVRDQYCDMIRKGKKGYHLMDTAERVDRYIHEYSRRYDEMHRLLEDLPANVLHVRFEDLIFHYRPTKKKVEDFLGIREHRHPKKYFDPKVAAGSTGLYRKHENRTEIQTLEQCMHRWLYPFKNEEGMGNRVAAGRTNE